MAKCRLILEILCVGFFIFSVIGSPIDDAESQDDEPQRSNSPVSIVSQPMNVSVSADAEVKLPCDVLHTDSQASLIWSLNTTILFVDATCILQAGVLKNVSCKNYQMDGHNLIIKRVGDNGYGRYSCKFRNEELTHEVGLEPSVEIVHAKKSIEAGQDLVLVCKASGYPEPKVMWFRQSTSDSPKVTIGTTPDVVVHSVTVDVYSGIYTCSAFNDRNQVASKSINVTVINGVSAEAKVVNAGESISKKSLCCKFDKYKPIIWSKSHKDLSDGNPRFSIQSLKHKSCIIFPEVKEDDLGVYSCRVKTESGASISTEISLTGTPTEPKLESTILDASHNPVLKWSVKSALSPITKFVIRIKKAEETDNDWKTFQEQPVTGNGQDGFDFTFIGLSNGVYDVELEVFNKFGSSKLKSPSTVVIDVPNVGVIAEKINSGATSNFRISILLLILPFLWW